MHHLFYYLMWPIAYVAKHLIYAFCCHIEPPPKPLKPFKMPKLNLGDEWKREEMK